GTNEKRLAFSTKNAYNSSCLSLIHSMSGSDCEEVTPVPIPNTAVKLFSADGSWGVAPARVGRRQAISFHSSSVVEQSAVNRSVVGSNPTCGAMESCPSGGRSTIGNRVGYESGLEESNQSLSATFNIRCPLVKWLRHRPFTAVSGVRIPYGSPFSHIIFCININCSMRFRRISSAGRALVLQARGRRFKSCILHHSERI